MDPGTRLVLEHPVSRNPEWRQCVREDKYVCFVWRKAGVPLYQLSKEGADARFMHQIVLADADNGVVGVVARGPL